MLAYLGGALMAPSLAGCSRAPRVEPAGGERVVSLAPNTTEIMFALGAGDLLVGRSSACNQPPEALALPVVGGFGTPNVEVLLSLRPTVVVGSRGPAGPVVAEQLRKHGVEVLLPPTQSVEDVLAALALFGERFGRRQRAARAVEDMRVRMAQVQAWARRRSPLKALMVFDANPNYVAGPGGFVDALLQRVGARNVVERGGPYPVVGIERLLRLDPDVVVDAMAPGRPGPSRLLRAPGWTLLRAVEQGRVRRLASDAALRPGPRLALGLAELAAAVHGAAP